MQVTQWLLGRYGGAARATGGYPPVSPNRRPRCRTCVRVHRGYPLPMPPLASVSGPLFIAVVVGSAALFLGWLLRADTREEQAAKAEREQVLEAERDGVSGP